LTKSLAKETAGKDISVNAITPAAAKTAIFEQMTQQHIDFMLSKIPRGRFVLVDEIAALAICVFDEAADHFTGENGGLYATMRLALNLTPAFVELVGHARIVQRSQAAFAGVGVVERRDVYERERAGWRHDTRRELGRVDARLGEIDCGCDATRNFACRGRDRENRRARVARDGNGGLRSEQPIPSVMRPLPEHDQRRRPALGRIDDCFARPADDRLHVPLFGVGDFRQARSDRTLRIATILLVRHGRQRHVGDPDRVREWCAHREDLHYRPGSSGNGGRHVQCAGGGLVSRGTDEQPERNGEWHT